MRFLFPGDLVLLPADAEGISRVAAGAVLTWWDDDTLGDQHTDIVATDGVTPITELVTDNNGLRPYVFGPDDVKVMFMDTGAALRFVVYSSDALTDLLTNAPDPGGTPDDIDGETF